MKIPPSENTVIAWYIISRSMNVMDSPVMPYHLVGERHAYWWQKAIDARGAFTYEALGITEEDVALYSSIRLSPEIVAAAEHQVIATWQLTELRNRVSEIMKDADDPNRVIADLRALIDEVSNAGPISTVQHRKAAVKIFQDWVEGMREQEQRIIPHPIRKLRDKLGGWRRGKLYLVGAVTSGHKTTFARMSAWHAAAAGFEAIFWTMEDSAEDVAARTLAATIPVFDTRTFSSYRWPRGFDGTEEDLWRMIAEHCDMPAASRLHYIDRPAPTISEVLSTLSQVAARGAAIVVLDFLQLIRPDSREPNEARHWFEVVNALAASAKRLNIAIVVTVQPTQEATREHKRSGRPLSIGDMRGGAAIAQAAYGVLLLNRVFEDGAPLPGVLEIDIAKWKSAQTGVMTVNVDAPSDLITDPSDDRGAP